MILPVKNRSRGHFIPGSCRELILLNNHDQNYILEAKQQIIIEKECVV